MKLNLSIGSTPRSTFSNWINILTRSSLLGESDFKWTEFTPNVTTITYPTMTLSSIADQSGWYLKINQLVVILVRTTFTTGGVAQLSVDIVPPILPSVKSGSALPAFCSGTIVDGGSPLPACIYMDHQRFLVGRPDGALWGLGAGRLVIFGAVYKVDA